MPPSRGDDCFFDIEVGYGEALTIVAPHIPFTLFTKAWSSLQAAIAEATEEGDPAPSVVAQTRAKDEISAMALGLSRNAGGQCPVLVATAARTGDIEIVGYYKGVLGRDVIRIDQNGAMSILTTTKGKAQ